MTRSSAVYRRIILALSVLAIACNVQAKWTRVAGFPDVINTGFFFNEQRGLIGLDYPSGIYRTYDGGATWQRSLVPSGYYGTVNDIFMRDSLNGWAITEKLQNDNIFNEQMMWKTTDGGVTWEKVPGVVEMGTSVYETPAGLLLYTKRYGPPIPGLWASLNGGAVFAPMSSDPFTDIDFVDDLHGVASPFTSTALWTADGGMTWVPTNYSTESWGVFAEKGTPNFVMAGEQNIGTYSKVTSVSRSTNFGITWNPVGTIPIRSTGHIAGVGKVMYVQSDNLHSYNFNLVQGMYRSTDGGYNWKWVEGPNHYRDSRFCVVGCLGGIVYAFDGVGGVWKTVDGGDGLITEPPKSPTFLPARAILTVDKCSNLRDTFQLSNLSCEAVTIESIEFFDSTMELITSGALAFGSLPRLPLKLDPAAADVLSINWDPKRSSMSIPAGTNFIRIRSSALDGAQRFDTLLTVVVNVLGNKPTPLLKSDTIKMPSTSICETQEDIVTIGNMGCDAMYLTDAAIKGPEWEVFDKDGNAMTFPIMIPSKTAAELKVRFTPAAIGTFGSDLDMTLEKDGFKVDTNVTVSCRVFRAKSVASADQVDLGNVPICAVYDTTVYIYSSATCETLTLDSILIGAGDFTITHDPLPYQLAPKDSFAVHIHYVPRKNTASASSLMAYFSATAGDTLSASSSIFGFGLPGTSGILFSDNYASYAFPNRTQCGVADSIQFSVRNPGCDTLTLISCEFTSSVPGAFEYRVKEQLPSAFGISTDRVNIVVVANPLAIGSYTASLKMNYRLSDNSLHDTTFNFSSEITEGPRVALISRNAVDFGQTALCESRDSLIEIMNTGCADVTIRSVNIFGSPQYLIKRAPKTPFVLKRFQRDTVIVSYIPTQPGEFAASVTIELNTDFDSVNVVPVDVRTRDKDYLTMQLVERAQGLYAGDTILFDLVPNVDWGDPALTNMSFDLFYDDDLLTFIHDWPKPTDGAAITEGDVTGSQRKLHIELDRASGLGLKGGIPVVTVAFQTALTDTNTTQMTLTGMRMNDNNAYYSDCILGADSRDTAFTLELRCGEPIVQKFLLGRSLFSISQHRPNPLTKSTGYTLKIPVRIEEDATIKAIVFDEQGRPVLEKEFTSLASGTHTLELECATLPSGSYGYVLSLNGERSPVSAKFMIMK